MEREEVNTELSMNYYDLCNYLKRKYGNALYDYFSTPECKSRNPKIGRGIEGLYCHHIDEDKGSDLSGPVSSQRQPFEWQKADRLVYCNLLEHLILHLKICILRQKMHFYSPSDIMNFLTTGGFQTISSDITTLFQTQGGTKKYQQKSYEIIRENLDEFILILNLALKYIDDRYLGKKEALTGIRVEDWALKPDDTPEIMDKKNSIYERVTFFDNINTIAKECSTTYDGTLFLPVYESLRIDNSNTELDLLSRVLLQDFHGFGFPQFNRLYLESKEYGCSIVDEYISKAFPAYKTPSYTINSDKPIFWKGDIPKDVLRSECFFLVRFLSIFQIKNNCEPFIYDHSYVNSWLGGMSNDNNFISKRGIIISNSDGRRALTLTKEDFELFMQTHEIKGLKILDGCYFK